MLLLRDLTITLLAGPLPVVQARCACDIDSKISSRSLSLWDSLKRTGVWWKKKKMSYPLQKLVRRTTWIHRGRQLALGDWKLYFIQWFSNFIHIPSTSLGWLLKATHGISDSRSPRVGPPQNAFLTSLGHMDAAGPGSTFWKSSLDASLLALWY